MELLTEVYLVTMTRGYRITTKLLNVSTTKRKINSTTSNTALYIRRRTTIKFKWGDFMLHTLTLIPSLIIDYSRDPGCLTWVYIYNLSYTFLSWDLWWLIITQQLSKVICFTWNKWSLDIYPREDNLILIFYSAFHGKSQWLINICIFIKTFWRLLCIYYEQVFQLTMQKFSSIGIVW